MLLFPGNIVLNLLRNLLHILGIIAVSFAVSLFMLCLIGYHAVQGYLQWIVYAVLAVGLYLAVFVPLSYISYPPMRRFVKRIIKSF